MAIASEYEAQAGKFLQDTGTKIQIEFVKYGHHFGDDEMAELKRDIYKITYTRGSRSFFVEFGQSLNKSRNKNGTLSREKPTAYDALTCLEKNDPGTFKEFCSEFGYDEDSKKAEKIYYACKKQWMNVQRLWTDEEIEKLAEIQ